MEAALAINDDFPDRYCLEQIVARSGEGFILLDACDPGLPIAFVNPAFESLTGYRAGELIGKRWHVLRRDSGQHPGVDELHAAIERAEAIEVELPDQRKDGTVWMARTACSALRDAQGVLRYLLVQQTESRRPAGHTADAAAARDAGRLRSKSDKIAKVDPLTRLSHYDQFAAIVNRNIALARRDGQSVALMLFEIVDLDIYRQTFGAKAADSCVRMVGAQLASMLRRAGDLYARYDDTRLVAAAVGSGVADAERLGNRIVQNVRELHLHNPRARGDRYVHVEMALSCGVPRPADHTDSLVEQAKHRLALKQLEAIERVRNLLR